jgi:hypothetical protein
MPDVKPRPRAGAIRLSPMSADHCMNIGEIIRPALCLQ